MTMQQLTDQAAKTVAKLNKPMQHITHTGEIIKGERLQKALIEVSKDCFDLAFAIYYENAYSSHISEIKKMQILLDSIKFAENIKTENKPSFTIWQRINEKLTGQCISFLK